MIHTMISRKIIKPHNCIMCFGIPTSKEGYEEKLHRFEYGYSHLFEKKYGRDAFHEYKKQFLNDLVKFTPVLNDLGLRIMYETDIDTFSELFESKRYDVVILFSHSNHKRAEIEFHDGFADSAVMVEKIPITFSGIIDLSVCGLLSVVREIRNKRINCIVRYNTEGSKPKPYFWIHFYRVLFDYLKQSNNTYLGAIRDVVHELYKKT